MEAAICHLPAFRTRASSLFIPVVLGVVAPLREPSSADLFVSSFSSSTRPSLRVSFLLCVHCASVVQFSSSRFSSPSRPRFRVFVFSLRSSASSAVSFSSSPFRLRVPPFVFSSPLRALCVTVVHFSSSRFSSSSPPFRRIFLSSLRPLRLCGESLLVVF